MSSRAREIQDVLAGPRARFFLLAAVASLVVFSRAGDGILANYDDCYYAEKAKQMIEGGDWLTPHFGGQIRLDNPPLFLWLVAFGFKLFGIGKYGAVFFPALAAVGCVLLLTRVARRLGLDDFEAWAAATMLLTTQYFLKYAGHGMMDVVLTLLFLVGVDGYLSGNEGKRRGWVQLGMATGLGILMKSVLGGFPLALAVTHRLVVKRYKVLTDPGIWIAALVAAAVGLPWFSYQLAVHRETLLSEHFRWLLVSRGFTDPARAGIRDSIVGYVYGIVKLYWPWLPFAAAGLWMTARRAASRAGSTTERSSALFLLLWIAVLLGPMSLAHVKKLWYVMSVFPGLALLGAIAAGRLVQTPDARRRAVSWSAGALVAFAGVAALGPVGMSRPRQADLVQIARVVKSTVPAGETIVNLDAPYWDVANLFVFYSSHDLSQPLADPARVREEVERGRWALIPVRRVDEVVGAAPAGLRVAARSGDWALLSPVGATPVVLEP